MQTEEKLKKKLKINKVLIVSLLFILFIILSFVVIKILHKNNIVTNNDGNLGLATQNEKIMFYYDYDNGLLRKDNKETKLLSEDQAYSINYLDGKLYYTTPNSTGGINIKRINVDGKEEKNILSITSSSTKMYLYDSKIYYLTSNPDTISRIDLDGKNEEVLIKRSVVDFKVVDGKIYFSDIMGFLYSLDTNGENYKLILEESKFNKFQILNNYVYYFDDGRLFKINLDDTSKKEEVTNKLDCDTYNVTSEGIYYLDKTNEKIKWISLNGKKEKEITSINTDNTKINIIGTAIYYVDNFDGKTITKIVNKSGKEIK